MQYSVLHDEPAASKAGACCAAFPAYQGASLSTDLAGGVVLALVVVAQGLAAGSVAQVSLSAGVYSGIVPPLAYGLLGSSRHMSVGGGALVSMVVAEQVASLPDVEARTRAAGVLAFLAGCIMFGMGVSGLGFLVRFISRPALKGLISASGLLLVFGQVDDLLGVHPDVVWSRHMLSDLNPGTSVLSFSLICFVTGLGRFKGKPGALGLLNTFKELLALMLGTALAKLVHNTDSLLSDKPITLLGEVPAGLPHLTWPLSGMSLADVQAALPGALAVAVASFVNSFAGAKAVALQRGYSIDATRELLALGLACGLGGCSGGIPILGSLNRTSLAATMVHSQLGAGAVVGVAVALCMALFAPLLRALPRCAVAVLIVTSSYPLVDIRKPLQLLRMHDTWGERTDFFTWVAAFIITLWQGVVSGIVVAVSLSLLLLVYEVMQPAVHVLGRTSAGLWVRLNNQYAQSKEIPGVLVVRVDGPLFFANAEYFQERVFGLLEEAAGGADGPVRKLVLEASKVTFLDETSVEVLQETAAALRDQGVALSIVEAPARSHALLRRTLPELHPKAERGFRVTVNEVLGLPAVEAS